MVTEGLITVQDVEVAFYSHRHLRQLPANIAVREIMNREVHAVRASTPLLELIELLLDKVYRALPVVDEANCVVGFVTEGDLLSKVKLIATTARRQLTRDEMAAELLRLRRIDQTVAKAMTPDPIMVTDETTISETVALMIKHHVKRLPVIDSENKLEGIVSRIDVLRALAQPPAGETPRKTPRPGRHTLVSEIMVTDVPTVRTETSLTEVVGLLVNNFQRRVVVIDDQRQVIGIVTDGDLIKRATTTECSSIIDSLSREVPLDQADSFHLSQCTATEVMTEPVITVTPETTLLDALQLLLAHQIKRLPVVNAEGQLVGLVGRDGILQAIGPSTGLNVPVK
jgi:CBS-domain-containing membrane protein